MKNILFKNGRFLIKDQQGYHLYIGNCCVHNGIIQGFDIDSFPFEKCFDLKGCFVIPSLFNTHVHLGESLFRNIKGIWTLEKYLDYTNAYNNNLDANQRGNKWNESALYTIANMIKNGCSTICSARSGIAQEFGLKVLSGYPLMASGKLESFFKEGILGYQKFRKDNNKVGISSGLFIHSLYQIESEYLKLSQEIQNEGIDFLTTHISETENTRNKEISKFGKRPIETLLENKLLGFKTILVHCNYLDAFELKLVAARKSSITICPISNIFLGEKPLNPQLLDEYGVEWYISTDGVATGRTFSMFRQLRCIKRLYPDVDFQNLFESITIRPARKFLINNYAGEIKEGYAADFVIIDYKTGVNASNIFDWLINDTPKIKDLIVNGQSLNN